MKMLYVFSLLLANMLSHKASNHLPATSVKIEGIVVSEKNAQPVSQAYLFVVKGEEETITRGNGRFEITTWQSFPVSLTIEHPDYRKIKFTIKAPGAKQMIRLEPK